MSEANAPFDSSDQPESDRSSQSSEAASDPAGSGRPKAFSELKTLTDLDLTEPDSAKTASGSEPAFPDQTSSESSPERSVWHNVRHNVRHNNRRDDQQSGKAADSAQPFSQDEIEFDISRIFDASDLDGLAFEGEASGPPASAELSLEDLWPAVELPASPDPVQSQQAQSVQPQSIKPEVARFEEADPAADLTGSSRAASDAAALTASWSQESGSAPEVASELPSLVDLIGLIQELNQCNGVLIDRVSQLEEALEYSQSALQAEVGRVHDSELGQDWNNSQDWATVQDQVANLFNQLEFAHQTNQRQQILIETLTSQLENSQERVAQLEREAALIQQRYDEQAQLLLKSEYTNRDLQARLQRQQRYTLQFKVALEKSLEVATPPYEAGLYETKSATLTPEDVLLLPKAKQIQPWSSQSQMSLSQSAWMKLQSLPLAPEGATAPPAAEANTPQSDRLEGIRLAAQPAGERAAESTEQTTHLQLPDFGMPLLQFEPTDGSTAQDTASMSDPTANPALKHQLDEVVKPLADMLAEAMLAGSPLPTGSAPRQEPLAPLTDSPAAEPAAPTSPPAADQSEQRPEQLLASVMADAEDALWQDLARLIDVSTEDVVKASLSGDLAAFESIDFAALNSATTPPQADPPPSEAVGFGPDPAPKSPQLTEQAAAVASLLRRQSQNQTKTSSAASETAEVESTDAPETEADQTALAPASWPSPVVYPLRPVKKRQSLAMVDLPTFPRPQ